jgi:hypothetical protein
MELALIPQDLKNKTNFYEEIEEYRKNNDIIWKLMDGHNKNEMWNHIDGIIKLLKDEYKNFEEIYNVFLKNKKTQNDHQKSSKLLELAEWIRDNEDNNIRFAFFSLAILNEQAIRDYIKKNINDSSRFDYWVDRVLSIEYQKLINGNSSLDQFVRAVRVQYVVSCGLPQR